MIISYKTVCRIIWNYLSFATCFQQADALYIFSLFPWALVVYLSFKGLIWGAIDWQVITPTFRLEFEWLNFTTMLFMLNKPFYSYKFQNTLHPMAASAWNYFPSHESHSEFVESGVHPPTIQLISISHSQGNFLSWSSLVICEINYPTCDVKNNCNKLFRF